ncbi:MAG: hypothetical protein HY901_05845 [Deltaproteobacteria bacterium]|nr:hypothetical protein [Deltaproteobacteria bacterium]
MSTTRRPVSPGHSPRLAFAVFLLLACCAHRPPEGFEDPKAEGLRVVPADDPGLEGLEARPGTLALAAKSSTEGVRVFLQQAQQRGVRFASSIQVIQVSRSDRPGTRLECRTDIAPVADRRKAESWGWVSAPGAWVTTEHGYAVFLCTGYHLMTDLYTEWRLQESLPQCSVVEGEGESRVEGILYRPAH